MVHSYWLGDADPKLLVRIWSQAVFEHCGQLWSSCAKQQKTKFWSHDQRDRPEFLYLDWTVSTPLCDITLSACLSYIVALSIKTIETDAAEPDMSFFFPTSYSNSIPAVYRHVSFASWGSTLAVSVFVAWSCRRDRIFLYQRERICNIQKDEIEKIK